MRSLVALSAVAGLIIPAFYALFNLFMTGYSVLVRVTGLLIKFGTHTFVLTDLPLGRCVTLLAGIALVIGSLLC